MPTIQIRNNTLWACEQYEMSHGECQPHYL